MGFRRLNRREVLRGAGGVALALPFLDCMAMAAEPETVRRMVCVGTSLSFVPDEFFPAAAGRDYALPGLLKPLGHLRNDFTVLSGFDHGVNAQGGHLGTHAFLSGVLSSNAKNYPLRNITVDQLAAEHVGAKTRYPSLQLSPETDSSNKMSWNRAGVSLMPVESLQRTFDLLFRQEDAAAIALGQRRIEDSQSILDVVNDQAKALGQTIGANDRERLDQYLTSVRELELRLVQNKEWLEVPKPKTGFELPGAADQKSFQERVTLFYDLMALALQTDSTRVISLELSHIKEASSGFAITHGYHALSHHGKIPEMLAELHVIELFHMQQFARFLDKLKTIQEPSGATLFDSTMSLIGSGLGNASSHSNKSIPLLLAGGGFRHGQHIAVSPEKQGSDVALAGNLYVSMLQRFGIERDEFNGAKHRVTGLELA